MRTLRQLLNFGTIGIVSNALLYCLYLIATSFGVGPKVAMTLVFVLGVLWTYTFNRRLTFQHRGAVAKSALRYLGAYGLAYALNLAALALLVDVMGLPHPAVMLSLTAATAALLFVSQKYWVFSANRAEDRAQWSG